MSQQNATQDHQLSQKIALKEEAKQMLLKQCYKMATNKYLRLISMGSKGFTQRQWAIIHLNTAISMQFQSRFKQALQKVNESIKIDMKYEKAYYRRVQILDEMGEYQLIIHKSVVPQFIKNTQIESLVKQLRQRYKKTIGLVQLKKKMEDRSFLENVGNEHNQKQFILDCLSNAFKRIKQALQEECRQFEKNSDHTISDILLSTKQQIAFFYQFLKAFPNQQILNKFFQHVYKLCLQYLFNKESTFFFITQLFSHFWPKFVHLESSLRNREVTKSVFSNEEIKKEDRNFAIQLILYCPLVIYNYQLFVELLSLGTAGHIYGCSLSTKLSKFVHNNLSFVKKLVQLMKGNLKIDESFKKLVEQAKQKDYNEKKDKIFELTKVINIFIQTSTQKQAQLNQIQKITEIQPLISEILSLQELLTSFLYSEAQAKNYYMNIQEQFINKSIVKLYRILYQLRKNQQGKDQERKSYPVQLLQLIFSLLSKNSFTVVQLYISYTSIHCLEIKQLIRLRQDSSEPYKNLQQMLLKLIISEKLNGKLERGEPVLILLINILSYLNPVFIAQASSDNKNQKCMALLRVFDQLTKVDEVFEKMKKNSEEKRKRVLFSIYLELLTSLAVSNINFLKNMLTFNKEISQIFFLLFGEKVEEKTNFIEAINTNRNAIKLLYVLTVDVYSERQNDYAEKMGVSREDIIKAKKLQGENLDKNLLSSIQGLRNKFISEVSSKQLSNKWDACLNNIIQFFNEYINSQSTVDQDMISGTLSKLAEKEAPRLLSPTIVNFMLNIYQKYKSKAENSIEGKICYKSCRFFSSVCKKVNANIIQYQQLQPIADSLVCLIKRGKHQLHIFQSYLSLINLSGKKINIELSVIETGLIEENPYIVHGSLQLLNNLLVNTDFSNGNFDKKYWQKFKRIHQYAFKYYRYYKNIIEEFRKANKVKSELGTNNYSHPFKLYCTLISLLLVIQSVDEGYDLASDAKYFVEEIKYWEPVRENLDFMEKNGGNVDLTLFKFVLHHAENKTLKKDWSRYFQHSLKVLRENDSEKWAKLQKYIK